MVNEQILRLQIPIDEVKRMQVLEREHDLSCVESSMRLTEYYHRCRETPREEKEQSFVITEPGSSVGRCTMGSEQSYRLELTKL